MKIGKIEYIRMLKFQKVAFKLRKKIFKFKIIKRRKSLRHRHLVTGLTNISNLNYKLIKDLSPQNDYNLINKDFLINYGSATNYLNPETKINLQKFRYNSPNTKLITSMLIGSNRLVSWKTPYSSIHNSNARDIIYQSSYVYYPSTNKLTGCKLSKNKIHSLILYKYSLKSNLTIINLL